MQRAETNESGEGAGGEKVSRRDNADASQGGKQTKEGHEGCFGVETKVPWAVLPSSNMFHEATYE